MTYYDADDVKRARFGGLLVGFALGAGLGWLLTSTAYDRSYHAIIMSQEKVDAYRTREEAAKKLEAQ